MKKTLNIQLLLLGLFLGVISASAQEEAFEPIASVIPKYVSDKGYWVVEGNVSNKQEHTIHFYNNDHLKVYQQTITGKFKINKRKTLMHMKRMLDTAVVAWQQKRPVNENLFAATK
jgi:hypothetical protein